MVKELSRNPKDIPLRIGIYQHIVLSRQIQDCMYFTTQLNIDTRAEFKQFRFDKWKLTCDGNLSYTQISRPLVLTTKLPWHSNLPLSFSRMTWDLKGSTKLPPLFSQNALTIYFITSSHKKRGCKHSAHGIHTDFKWKGIYSGNQWTTCRVRTPTSSWAWLIYLHENKQSNSRGIDVDIYLLNRSI